MAGLLLHLYYGPKQVVVHASSFLGQQRPRLAPTSNQQHLAVSEGDLPEVEVNFLTTMTTFKLPNRAFLSPTPTIEKMYI